METATGLGAMGRVRALEPPHTGGNYLLHEMVHVVGRKHSRRLRVIAVVLASALPTILLLLPFSHALAGLAVLAHVAGMLAARWLFFAEAEHVVGLYYGKR
jgi:DMSO reductase anchor subunit